MMAIICLFSTNILTMLAGFLAVSIVMLVMNK